MLLVPFPREGYPSRAQLVSPLSLAAGTARASVNMRSCSPSLHDSGDVDILFTGLIMSRVEAAALC